MMWHGKNFRGFLHHALQVLFDNTGTTLSSTNVEDAIKEVDGKLLKFKALETTITLESTDSNSYSIAPYSKSFSVSSVSGYPSNVVCLIPLQAFMNNSVATALLQANLSYNLFVISSKQTGTYTVRFGVLYTD